MTARNLIQAAESDWKAFDLNKRIRAELKKPHDDREYLAEEPIREYAFGAHVVEAAKSPADILRRAVDLRKAILGGGETTHKRLPLSTFRVYQDADVLAEAAKMASKL